MVCHKHNPHILASDYIIQNIKADAPDNILLKPVSQNHFASDPFRSARSLPPCWRIFSQCILDYAKTGQFHSLDSLDR
jgi:hypothetical protein